MTGKLNKAVSILGMIIVGAAYLAGEYASSATLRMNVFERFRIDMAVAPAVAATKYMTPAALTKWNRNIMPSFDKKDRQVRHFFEFSVMMPKKKASDLFVIFFNPWVDGALFTQWKKSGETWMMNNFYLASGERIRGELTPQSVMRQSQILPIWQWYKGTFLRNIFSYYKDMRSRIAGKNIDEYLTWLSLSEPERKADLLRVSLRMGARVMMTDRYTAKDQGGPVLTGAFSKLKYDALTDNKTVLTSYSRHADILVGLRPEIIKSFKENWVFKKNNTYTTVLSSPLLPRSFIFMNVTANGIIEGALFCDLETMATMLRIAASTVGTAPVQPVRAAFPTRKVQRYKDANGNQIEIITERRGSKVTMTTRINGIVTEVLNF